MKEAGYVKGLFWSVYVQISHRPYTIWLGQLGSPVHILLSVFPGLVLDP